MYNAYVIGILHNNLLLFKRDSQGKIRDVEFGIGDLKSECIIYDLDEAQAIVEDLQTNYGKSNIHIYQLGTVKEITQ